MERYNDSFFRSFLLSSILNLCVFYSLMEKERKLLAAMMDYSRGFLKMAAQKEAKVNPK